MKTIKDYTLFVTETLQKALKEGKLIIERQEVDAEKSEVTIEFVSVSKKCPKKMSATFDYNELAHKHKYYYRKRRKGDTIRVTGDRGQRLFNSNNPIELNDGVELGVECVVVIGEDDAGDVVIPRGILKHHVYLSAKCTELVKSVEESET